jgi:hypothetical protein
MESARVPGIRRFLVTRWATKYRRPLCAGTDARGPSATQTGTTPIDSSNYPQSLQNDLAHQAVDATTGHAQAPPSGLTAEQQQAIVAFEMGLISAQANGQQAGGLSAGGATGGPQALSQPTDPYWARSRTLEYLAAVQPKLPAGVRTELGPDATRLGWVYEYVLLDKSGKHGLDELRSYQDWYFRYFLKSVPGVADVTSLGGYGREYQINIDPNRLRFYGIPISRVVGAVRGGNAETGGHLMEFGGTEYMVRGRGYARPA